VELFRNNLRLVNARKGISQSAFAASYQGRSIDESGDGEETGGAPPSKAGSNPPKKKTCLCEVPHFFGQCPYIVESIQTSDWKPDPQIKKQVDEKIKEGSPGLKAAIARAQNKAKDKKDKKDKEKSTADLPTETENSTPKPRKGSFPVHVFVASTSQSDYDLRDSFLADCAANAHVSNQRERFYDLQPAGPNDFVYAGDSILPIEGFGSVDIFPETPEGKCTITLRDVALIPSFHTSIVSLRKFKAKKVFFDGELDQMVKNGKTYCYLGDHYEQ